MFQLTSAKFMMHLRLCIALVIAGLFVQIKGQCDGAVDLIIAIPSGWNVPNSDLKSFEENLIDLMYYFNIAPSQFNIGLIRYGKRATVFSNPQPFKFRPQVNTRITLLAQRTVSDGRKLNVAKAILKMNELAFTPNILRYNARKFGIIFTYMDSKNSQKVEAAAKLVKANGMVLHAIRAAGNGSKPTFQNIGTDFCRVVSMSSFETGLKHLIPDLASTICSELDPTISVTSKNCRPGKYPKTGPFAVTCARVNNMVQPDPNNCAYFYRCDYYNTVPQRLACPNSLLYDPYTKVCNFARDVACYTDLRCPTAIPQLYPHPSDCQKFINCDTNFVPHVQSCPPNSLFDPDWQTCNVTREITCILPRI